MMTRKQQTPSEDAQLQATGVKVAKTFRASIHTMRTFQVLLSQHIISDQHLDEQERQQRLAEVDETHRKLDEWERNLELLLLQGMTRQTQVALLVMAKRLRQGIEDCGPADAKEGEA
jgi:riboflavin synthase